MAEADPEKVYQALVLEVLGTEDVTVDALHADTTSVSVHGAYDSDDETALKVTFGYSKDKRLFLLVDGAQAAGALDLDFRSLNCDAYAPPAYKWCLGPEGIGVLYVNSRAHDRLDPPVIARGATITSDLDGNYTLDQGARLFAPSTRGVMGPLGMAYSLDYLANLGRNWVEARIESLTSILMEQLWDLPGVEIITPGEFSQRAGLVSFAVPGAEPSKMKEALEVFLARGVHVRAIPVSHCGAPELSGSGAEDASRPGRSGAIPQQPGAIRASLHICHDWHAGGA